MLPQGKVSFSPNLMGQTFTLERNAEALRLRGMLMFIQDNNKLLTSQPLQAVPCRVAFPWPSSGVCSLTLFPSWR